MMLESSLLILGIFAIAFVFAPVGMGGGMLFVPLLHYGADWPIDGTLLAVSLGLTAVVSYGSGLAHRREGHHDDATIRSALKGAVPGAVLGVGIVVMLADNLDPVFKSVSVFMLAWAAVKTQRKMASLSTEEQDEAGAHEGTVNHLTLRAGSGIGGLLSSVLAIGAGVIYVPVLQQIGQLQTRKAIGSSLHLMMVVVPVAIITHLIFLSAGEWQALRDLMGFVLLLPLAAYVGSTMGARFGLKYMSQISIMRVFLALVVITFLRYLLDLIETLS
jgi:uncharacterized membrane protein YfcA